jgi:hypothetical protein
METKDLILDFLQLNGFDLYKTIPNLVEASLVDDPPRLVFTFNQKPNKEFVFQHKGVEIRQR